MKTMTAGEAPRIASWNFSKIPLLPPERASRAQPLPVRGAQPGLMQPKLAIGSIDDPLEREADAVADRVMRMPDPTLSISTAPERISRKCAACESEDEEEKKLQTKPAGTPKRVGEAPPIVHEVLHSPGEPLDVATRAFFEPRLGHDFSRVRIHIDEKADASAQSVGALAYTVGSHVVFRSAQYSPTAIAGRRLMAHELTHVVQQSAGVGVSLARQPAPKLPPRPAGPSLRVISGGAGRTAADAATELAEREAATLAERAGWREFWKVVAERFAVREGIAAALAIADGPLPIGDLIALGMEIWIIWDIIDLWSELWAEANQRLQTSTGSQPAPAPAPEEMQEPRADCFKTHPGAIACGNPPMESEEVRDEIIQNFLFNTLDDFDPADLGECIKFQDVPKIDQCGGAPGFTHHCEVNTSKGRMVVSIFACLCCDKAGQTHYEWQEPPHISDYQGKRFSP